MRSSCDEVMLDEGRSSSNDWMAEEGHLGTGTQRGGRAMTQAETV